MSDDTVLRRRLLNIERWDFYALMLLGVSLIWQASSWPNFPLFMDCYYHLSVMHGFADAGGWVGEALWEFAPVGRAHLYPPLYHIIELGLFRLGLDPISIARFSDFLISPLFLFVLWRFLRSAYSASFAFLALLLCLSSYSLYLALLNNTPFTLALIFGFLAVHFLNNAKNISAVFALVLSFYSHSFASWIIFFSIFFTGLFSGKQRRCFLTACLSALVLAAPLLWHQARYAAFIHPRRVVEFYDAQVNPVLYLLASAGLFLAVRRRSRFHFLIALTLAMSVLLLTHRDRFLSGHGLVAVSLLAAVALDELWRIFSCRRNRIPGLVFGAGVILLFCAAQPLMVFSPFRSAPVFLFDSGILKPASSDVDVRAVKGKSLYHPRFMDEAAELVRRSSRDDDIIFSNYPYVGGMIAVLARRATSSAMLGEVIPFFPLDPVRSARLILWLKNESGALPAEPASLTGAYRLKKVGETDLFYLYSNDPPAPLRRFSRARVPEGVCFFILAFVFFVFLFENKIIKKVDTKSPL